MRKKQDLREWVRECLDEETRGMKFTIEMKQRVRDQAMRDTQKPPRWWERKVSIPTPVWMAAVSLIVLCVFTYARIFFYITPGQIREFRNHEVVVYQGEPFGAVLEQESSSAQTKAGGGFNGES